MEFKKGDKILVKKYNQDGKVMPGWIDDMDYLDGKIIQVDNVMLNTTDSWLVYPDWCKKVEDTTPDEHVIKSNEIMEQREYNLYISLIHKCIDKIMSGDDTLIWNCRRTAKKIINEFKR